jgi:very-short-patch-repair endonuclease
LKKSSEKPQHAIFPKLCVSFGLPEPISEHKFLENRKFRFDFAWIDCKLAVEIEGGVWSNGRHTRGVGYVKDMEKYNLAVKNGWKVLRFTPQDLKKSETYVFISEVFKTIQLS